MTKPKFERGWWEEGAAEMPERKRMRLLIEQAKVTRSEDLPQFLSAKEAAPLLKVHYKTAAQMMRDKTVWSTKIGGRRFTTPQWIADYLDKELKKNNAG